jgi:hypothetical protein
MYDLLDDLSPIILTRFGCIHHWIYCVKSHRSSTIHGLYGHLVLSLDFILRLSWVSAERPLRISSAWQNSLSIVIRNNQIVWTLVISQVEVVAILILWIELIGTDRPTISILKFITAQRSCMRTWNSICPSSIILTLDIGFDRLCPTSWTTSSNSLSLRLVLCCRASISRLTFGYKCILSILSHILLWKKSRLLLSCNHMSR